MRDRRQPCGRCRLAPVGWQRAGGDSSALPGARIAHAGTLSLGAGDAAANDALELDERIVVCLQRIQILAPGRQ